MRLEKDQNNFLIGATLGCVLGAATALLFTPVSGRNLRKNILHEVQKREYVNSIIAAPHKIMAAHKTIKRKAKAPIRSKRSRPKVRAKAVKR